MNFDRQSESLVIKEKKKETVLFIILVFNHLYLKIIKKLRQLFCEKDEENFAT